MRSRIKGHRKVRVGDLVPHELNPRTHSDTQREALRDLLGEVGFARSLLAYELADGRLKLIDGHLRQTELDPDEEVDVEVLDVNDEEARLLLLSIDPLAQLAGYSGEALDKLRETVHTESEVLRSMHYAIDAAEDKVRETLASARKKGAKNPELPETYLVIVDCNSEQEQKRLLRRFKSEGLVCSAKTS